MKKLFLLILIPIAIGTTILNCPAQTWEPMGTNVTFNAQCFAEYEGELYAGTPKCDEIKGIGKLVGNKWTTVGTGFSNEKFAAYVFGITSLVVYKDELYAAGVFRFPGAKKAASIARWNGKEWKMLGEQLGGSPHPVINCLVVYKDELYVGGSFVLQADREDVCFNIAKWDGEKWSTVKEGGFERPVYDFTICNDELYVAGGFEGVWSVKTNKVIKKLNGLAKWDGENWLPLINKNSEYTDELITYNNEVYFRNAIALDYGAYSYKIKKCVGNECLPLPNQIDDAKGISQLTLYNGALYVVAWYSNSSNKKSILKWNGSKWVSCGVTDRPVQCMYAYTDELIISGLFEEIDGKKIKYMARYKEEAKDTEK